jgi:CelD/BcsL family acetyltransferase involved in cellulose biosynthesis
LSFIGEVEVSDYLDFIAPEGGAEAFYQALLAYLAGVSWQVLDLHCLPSSSSTLQHLPRLARERGYSVTLGVEEVCPALDLPPTWEDYLAQLHRTERHELRRKLRRLNEEARFRYYDLRGEEAIGAIDDFLHLHRASGHHKAAFMNQRMERFFRAMLAHFASRGWARLHFLEVDGKRVSVVLCFEYGDTVFLYNSGFDPSYSRLSVGLLLKAFCIRKAIEEGKRRFDFLRGNEHYKYDLGGKDVPIYRCQVRRD